MTHDEAILFLQAHRPGGGDDRDGFFEDALDRVQEDEVLREWFLAQQEFDRAISQTLHGVVAPGGLRERLLAGLVVVKPGFRVTYINWVALAASIALAIAVALNWRSNPKPADFAAYRDAIVPMVASVKPHLEVLDTDLAALNRALAERGAPEPTLLPRNLSGMKPSGCRVLEWNGHKVSMLCYLSKGTELDLLVVDGAGFFGGPQGDAPGVGLTRGWTTANWTDGERIYILAAKISPAELQKYL
jgi:hypothetical protein